MSFEQYADGSFFRRLLASIDDAFKWEEVRAWASPAHRNAVRRFVTRNIIEILPVIRNNNSRQRFLSALRAILREEPRAILDPQTWARLCYGLLPRSAIHGLRARKRNRWAARAAEPRAS
jgi:hypothetical protein